MLLLFFNGTAGDPTAPVFSTGNGVTCIHASLFTDELAASVLIAELSSRAAMSELPASAADITLSKKFTC